MTRTKTKNVSIMLLESLQDLIDFKITKQCEDEMIDIKLTIKGEDAIYWRDLMQVAQLKGGDERQSFIKTIVNLGIREAHKCLRSAFDTKAKEENNGFTNMVPENDKEEIKKMMDKISAVSPKAAVFVKKRMSEMNK